MSTGTMPAVRETASSYRHAFGRALPRARQIRVPGGESRAEPDQGKEGQGLPRDRSAQDANRPLKGKNPMDGAGMQQARLAWHGDAKGAKELHTCRRTVPGFGHVRSGISAWEPRYNQVQRVRRRGEEPQEGCQAGERRGGAERSGTAPGSRSACRTDRRTFPVQVRSEKPQGPGVASKVEGEGSTR